MKKNLILPIISLWLLVGFTSTQKLNAQNVDSLVQMVDNLTERLLYRNNDTNYIHNYSDEISAKIVAVNKINYFRIKDRNNKNTIKFRPVRDINVGIGLAYKFFAVDLTLSLGLSKNSELENTRSIDIQGRMFSSKQLASVTFQYYQGYQISHVTKNYLDENDPNARREDIRTTNFQLQYLYAFNYTKFSMKAPFVFNERQKKSAGSMVFGASFTLYNMGADSSIIPIKAQPYFNEGTQLTHINIINLGLKFGYMYTYVYKSHYFVTVNLSPGVVLNYGDYSLENRNNLPTALNLSLSSMNSIGYNGDKFFAGFSMIIDNFYTVINSNSRFEMGSGKISAFVGYRFGTL